MKCNPIIVGSQGVMDRLLFVSNKMRVGVVCRKVHHIRLSTPQYEMLDLVLTLYLPTSTAPVIQTPFRNHRETLCVQSI